MPPVNPAGTLQSAPFTDLIILLMRQFKRLFAEQDIRLTTDEMTEIARAAESRQADDRIESLKIVLNQMVEESQALIESRFQMSFAQSLKTDMAQLGGWHSTAEFLDIAADKSNAELRISAGATLLVMLGDARFAGLLLDIMEVDGGLQDVDAVLAQRALQHLTGISSDASDWLTQIEKIIRSA